MNWPAKANANPCVSVCVCLCFWEESVVVNQIIKKDGKIKWLITLGMNILKSLWI